MVPKGLFRLKRLIRLGRVGTDSVYFIIIHKVITKYKTKRIRPLKTRSKEMGWIDWKRKGVTFLLTTLYILGFKDWSRRTSKRVSLELVIRSLVCLFVSLDKFL